MCIDAPSPTMLRCTLFLSSRVSLCSAPWADLKSRTENSKSTIENEWRGSLEVMLHVAWLCNNTFDHHPWGHPWVHSWASPLGPQNSCQLDVQQSVAAVSSTGWFRADDWSRSYELWARNEISRGWPTKAMCNKSKKCVVRESLLLRQLNFQSLRSRGI